MKRNDQFVMRPVAGRFVLAPIGEMVKKFSGMVTLNSTGKFLWELLAEDKTLDELAKAMADAYEVDFEQSKKDIEVFLEPLRSIEAVID